MNNSNRASVSIVVDNQEGESVIAATSRGNDNDDEELRNLPKWMKQYMKWHRQRLMELSSSETSEWKNQSILIVRCLEQDRCGGTSDRLKSFPLFVLIAAKTHRLVFIRWTRPFQLEEFLQPGPGLNWSIPTELQGLIEEERNKDDNDSLYFEGKHVQKMIAAASSHENWLIEGNIQYSGGNLYTNLVVPYQKALGLQAEDYDYTSYYHDFFPNVFQLAPKMQVLWQERREFLSLFPNKYVVAHCRAKYPKEPYLESNKNLTILKETMVNAIECAIKTEKRSMVDTGVPSSTVVYVASDTVLAIELAQEYYNSSNIRIVSHLDILSPSPAQQEPQAAEINEDPPHLNFANKTTAEAFYSIFVDLWAMSQCSCVSFGAGGFGRFGSLVSYNMSCRIPHSIKGELQQC